ncbi:hypothetical protein [Streptomyces profundus]|uniref:hypothetical protein n=1 Tax=Streptomyces profundus TaxID=2867410 RepID=UPI001D16C376|nr:hypothetical protein [Streptomyces sp. MA3_2.13]UED86112.1 hypothetical protein K4G22_19555 [Streptomyces sp. MA3_2.13]
MTERALPSRVSAARRIALEVGFGESCVPEVGRLDATEVLTTPTTSAVVASRRPPGVRSRSCAGGD